MLEEFTTPITNEKQALAWWKKFRTLSNVVLLFFMAICLFCFVSVRLNLEMAISDPAKREYFSGLGFFLACGVPWLWNAIFDKVKKKNLQELKKQKTMQTKKASTVLVLSLIGTFLLGGLAYFLDFSLYTANYQKRQKANSNIHAMPLR
jgi:hypothetical protein